MVNGFEEYFSGYPIPRSSFYAFAKTWYAKELPRPGCVWTHTLLIEKRELSRVDDLSKLSALFSRPYTSSDFSQYSNAIIFDENLVINEGINDYYTSSQLPTEKVVRVAFFGLSPKPVFLVAPNARTFERIPLQIWKILWVGLRNRYSFCTGSLSNRVIEQMPFDLQIIPKSNQITIKREASDAIFLDEQTKVANVIASDRELLVLEEMLQQPAFLDFVRRYASDLSGGRESMKLLSSCFKAIEDTRDGTKTLSEFTETIASSFPGKDDAMTLKMTLYAPPLNTALKSGLLDKKEEELLLELMTTTHYSCLTQENLSIKPRTRSLWATSKYSAKKLLFDTLELDHNPLFDDFLSETASVLSLKDTLEVIKAKPKLLSFFVLNNHQLANSPEIWRASADVQREVFDVLADPNQKSSVDWNAVVSAIFAGGGEHLADRIVEKIGIAPLLENIDRIKSGPIEFSKILKRAVSSKDAIVCEWLESNSSPSHSSLIVLALSSEHGSCIFSITNLSPWVELSESLQSKSDLDIRTRLAAFLLAMGFSNKSQEAYKLVVRSFQIVYHAAETDVLPYDSWRILESLVPNLGMWRNWDKCERLLRGMAERYLSRGWPVSSFTQVTNREDLLRRLLKRFLKTGNGSKFVELLKKETIQTNKVDTLRRVIKNLASNSDFID